MVNVQKKGWKLDGTKAAGRGGNGSRMPSDKSSSICGNSGKVYYDLSRLFWNITSFPAEALFMAFINIW